MTEDRTAGLNPLKHCVVNIAFDQPHFYSPRTPLQAVWGGSVRLLHCGFSSNPLPFPGTCIVSDFTIAQASIQASITDQNAAIISNSGGRGT